MYRYICLHAHRYRGDGWDYEAPSPVWALQGDGGEQPPVDGQAICRIIEQTGPLQSPVPQ